MSSILFRPNVPAPPRSPNRADIALFVGSVRRRAGSAVDPVSPRARASDPLYRWLEAEGWTVAANRRGGLALEELLDVPVPIERWSDFDRLFDWEARSVAPEVVGATYLGAAVRSFFAEGGRRCYVVRVSAPWELSAPRAERDEALRLLVPEVAGRPTGSAVDRSTWRGVWHLYGLPEVSFVSLPDLPDAAADPPAPPLPLPTPPAVAEKFVECTTPAPTESHSFARTLGAPRCNEAGYLRWGRVLGIALDGLTFAAATSTLRETQLVAAVPLPDREDSLSRPADVDLLAFLRDTVALDQTRLERGLASAFLQLVYPWAETVEASALPEGLENPEGVLIGLLARNALLRGTFRSAAMLESQSVVDLEPRLHAPELAPRVEVTRRLGSGSDQLGRSSFDDAEQLATDDAAEPAGPELVTPVDNLVRRVSLLGRTPAGFRLLSDVTTSQDPSYRQAQVGRLVASVIRAARQLGQDELFEPSTPVVWSGLRSRIASMLGGLWRAGALRGESERDAYSVRCDRSTMSDDDIDRGRVIAEVAFDVAAAIDRITVSLSLSNGRALGAGPP